MNLKLLCDDAADPELAIAQESRIFVAGYGWHGEQDVYVNTISTSDDANERPVQKEPNGSAIMPALYRLTAS
jgi:hypothetical protein